MCDNIFAEEHVTMEKVPVASGKDLMTLRKDLMTVGKDRIWDLFGAREFP